MHLLGWGKSDVGMRRQQNEDSFFVDSSRGLFLVADGMGGHAGGELASRLAVELVSKELSGVFAQPNAPTMAPLESLVQAVEMACAVIFHVSREYPQLEGMGTTFTGVLLEDNRLHLAHVGDSRAYLYRHGEVIQLSQDHSLVQEMIRAGQMTPEEAKISRYRHVITRSVGFEAQVEVDATVLPLREGDIVMLCSDGLVNLVEDPVEIGGILGSTPFAQIPGRFIEIANERGGDDNITVVVAYVGEVSPRAKS
jgi:protein phosphatase